MKGTPLNDHLVDYMNRLFPAEDELLHELRREADAAGIPPIQISSEQGAFLQVLIRATGTRSILEIGTLAGYSAINMARALPEDGRLTTIERDPMHAEFARRQIERAGLSEKVRVIVGAGVDVLERELAGSGPYDLVFIDADKPSYVRYLELVYPMVRTGGLIAGDNALSWGRIAEDDVDDPSVKGMQAFNRAMAAHPGLQSCIVPIGDGVCMGVKLPG